MVVLEKEQLLQLVSVLHPSKRMDVSLLHSVFDYDVLSANPGFTPLGHLIGRFVKLLYNIATSGTASKPWFASKKARSRALIQTSSLSVTNFMRLKLYSEAEEE